MHVTCFKKEKNTQSHRGIDCCQVVLPLLWKKDHLQLLNTVWLLLFTVSSPLEIKPMFVCLIDSLFNELGKLKHPHLKSVPPHLSFHVPLQSLNYISSYYRINTSGQEYLFPWTSSIQSCIWLLLLLFQFHTRSPSFTCKALVSYLFFETASTADV